jgi:hypothetical protein
VSGHIDFVCAQATVGPHRLRLRPGDRALERRQPDALLEVGDLLLEHARPLALPEHTLRAEAEVGERLLYCHSSAPFRQM